MDNICQAFLQSYKNTLEGLEEIATAVAIPVVGKCFHNCLDFKEK